MRREASRELDMDLDLEQDWSAVEEGEPYIAGSGQLSCSAQI